MLFLCCLIDYSLLILWSMFDNISVISMHTFMTKTFVLISETLMFPCCFVDDSLMNIWRDIFEALIISLEAFLNFIVFVVLTSESFMFHCFFLKDSLMTLLRNIGETPKIRMQTLKINEVLNVIIIETLIPLLLDWLIVDNPMENLQKDFDDLDANISDKKFFCANFQNIDVSLLLRPWFVDDFWRNVNETLINSMETFLIFIVLLC